ncbi:MAG TPA: hypothetical protein PKY82_12720 [Pyrinomonadaceae bacterium]|nr:hypothetical protein [Pyrinomonadaceae bacterium]
MADVKISSEELELLRVIMSPLVIKSGTGELGINHGMDRFISSQVILKKKDLELLDYLAKKVGLSNGIKRANR